MINDDKVIDTLEELEAFLLALESGSLELNNVAG